MKFPRGRSLSVPTWDLVLNHAGRCGTSLHYFDEGGSSEGEDSGPSSSALGEPPGGTGSEIEHRW
jgi:hypothetical protein